MDDDNGSESGSAYVYYGDCRDEDEDGYCDTGKDGCGCSSNPAPGRGAGMLIGLLALVGLRRRKPRAVDEGGDTSVA